MYVCFASIHICSLCGFGAYSGHKRASYSLELNLKETVRVSYGCWKDQLRRKKCIPSVGNTFLLQHRHRGLNEENSTVTGLPLLLASEYVCACSCQVLKTSEVSFFGLQ